MKWLRTSAPFTVAFWYFTTLGSGNTGNPLAGFFGLGSLTNPTPATIGPFVDQASCETTRNALVWQAGVASLECYNVQ